MEMDHDQASGTGVEEGGPDLGGFYSNCRFYDQDLGNLGGGMKGFLRWGGLKGDGVNDFFPFFSFFLDSFGWVRYVWVKRVRREERGVGEGANICIMGSLCGRTIGLFSCRVYTDVLCLSWQRYLGRLRSST